MLTYPCNISISIAVAALVFRHIFITYSGAVSSAAALPFRGDDNEVDVAAAHCAGAHGLAAARAGWITSASISTTATS